jgi:tetratricopeptide (TPR) repeat protein
MLFAAVVYYFFIRKRVKDAPYNVFALMQKKGLASQAHVFFRWWVYLRLRPYILGNFETKRAFMSYSWPSRAYPNYWGQEKERAAVCQIVRDLEYAGVRAWHDKYRARIGDQLDSNSQVDPEDDLNVIKNGLEKSDAIILFGTKAYLKKCQKSKNLLTPHVVYLEAEQIFELAKRPDKRFIPLCVSTTNGVIARQCMPVELVNGRKTEAFCWPSEDYFNTYFDLIKSIYPIPSPNAHFEQLVEDFFVGLRALSQQWWWRRSNIIADYNQQLIRFREDVLHVAATEDWVSMPVNLDYYVSPPVRRNHQYVQRMFSMDQTEGPDELVEFQQLMSSFRFLALTGLPGSGKTQIAKNYFLESKASNRFSGYVWIEADCEIALFEKCGDFFQARRMGYDKQHPERSFQQFFSAKKNYLFVFDCCDRLGQKTLDAVLPVNTDEHTIVVTSTHTNWQLYRVVGAMSDAECICLYQKICGSHADMEGVLDLCVKLGRFVLALTQAFNYIRVCPTVTAGGYIHLFEHQKKQLLSKQLPPGLEDEHLPAWATFELILEKLPADAVRLLYYTALLPPEGASIALLQCIYRCFVGAGESIEAEERLNQAASQLSKYSLLSRSLTCVSAHFLIRSVAVDKMVDDRRALINEVAQAIVEQSEEMQPDISFVGRSAQVLITQLEYMVSTHRAHIEGDQVGFRLQSVLAYLCYRSFLYDKALVNFIACADILRVSSRILAHQQIVFYRRYAMLSSVMRDDAKSAECLARMQAIIDTNRASLPEVLVRFESDYSMLVRANTDSDNERFVEAEALLDGLAGRFVNSAYNDSYLAYKVYDLLGFCSGSQGSYDKALASFKSAMRILDSKKLGSTIEKSLVMSNVGDVLISLERFERARGYLTQALAIAKQLFGSVHPIFVGLYINLALVEKGLSQFANAESYLSKASKNANEFPGFSIPGGMLTFLEKTREEVRQLAAGPH